MLRMRPPQSPQLSKVRARKSITPEVKETARGRINPRAAKITSPKSIGKTHLAATTMISTLYCGDASVASTVARAGVLPADTQPSHTAFISWKVFMSVM